MLEIPITDVTDDEILYRRILDGLGLYEVQADGTVLFNSQAFADRSWRPSVDRAKLCNNDPKHTLGSFSGGVTSIVARDVRLINDIVQYDKNQNPIQLFKVDVEHVPIIDDPINPNNPAHAEIHTSPACPNRRVFKKLCEKLALLANARQWELKPSNMP